MQCRLLLHIKMVCTLTSYWRLRTSPLTVVTKNWWNGHMREWASGGHTSARRTTKISHHLEGAYCKLQERDETLSQSWLVTTRLLQRTKHLLKGTTNTSGASESLAWAPRFFRSSTKEQLNASCLCMVMDESCTADLWKLKLVVFQIFKWWD